MTSPLMRPIRKTDLGYFTRSWLASFRKADAVRGVASPTFYEFHHRVLERLFARGRVVVACDRADEDRILGFCCFEVQRPTLVLHYVFVRRDERGHGLGRAMIEDAMSVCDPAPRALVWTHSTGRRVDRWLDGIAAAHGLPALYNPYMIHEAA